MKRILLVSLFCVAPLFANASEKVQGDFLVKLKQNKGRHLVQRLVELAGQEGLVEDLENQWVHFKAGESFATENNSDNFLQELRSSPAVEYAQYNYTLGLLEDYSPKDAVSKRIVEDMNAGRLVQDFVPPALADLLTAELAAKDPALPSANVPAVTGADPLTDKQWGMKNIHANEVWPTFTGSKKVIVAVIDTGVDYTHEDLVGNLWHKNAGSPDDEIGWDFAQNDNKPYDIVSTSGNPGHGTHCAGNVGATGNNSKGISGVAPQVSIMSLRFITEKGTGTTANAIKAINYAVKNGAKILSNSWGSEGEDPSEPNQGLKDAINNAMKNDVLFVAAAGNGRGGKGYDNDKDSKPVVPASYDMDNIISVAALDSDNKLAKFSNWGSKTVDVGAPGVKIYSTTVGSKYSDTVLGGSWSGTSMATPHVAGAAAMIWAAHPEYHWDDVKRVLLSTVDKVPALQGKSVSGGKINVAAALK